MSFPPFIFHPILFTPLVAVLINNLIKLALHSTRGAVRWGLLYKDYGGMPSGHSAFVGAFMTAIYLTVGPTPLFLVALGFSFLLIHDLTSARWFFTNQSNLIEHLFTVSEKGKKHRHNDLGKRVGHTIPEIIVGLAIGIGTALLL